MAVAASAQIPPFNAHDVDNPSRMQIAQWLFGYDLQIVEQRGRAAH
jgi:hypothetical protein